MTTQPPEFRGAVPLGANGGQPAAVIDCIWHRYEAAVDHPPDAPQCWEQDGRTVINLGGLMSWIVVNLTQLGGIVNNMAKHLSEAEVLLEAMNAREGEPPTD